MNIKIKCVKQIENILWLFDKYLEVARNATDNKFREVFVVIESKYAFQTYLYQRYNLYRNHNIHTKQILIEIQYRNLYIYTAHIFLRCTHFQFNCINTSFGTFFQNLFLHPWCAASSVAGNPIDTSGQRNHLTSRCRGAYLYPLSYWQTKMF